MIKPINLSIFSIAKPAISAEALEIHYKQFYLKYVDTFNSLIKTDESVVSVLKLIINNDLRDSFSKEYNIASQIYNHEMFFEQFTGINVNLKESRFYNILLKNKYNYVNFVREVISKGADLFGSGYIWIFLDSNYNLQIRPFHNANNLVTLEGCTPLITIDLWEHSYLLDYGNDRKNYISRVLDSINYGVIDKRLVNK